MIIRSNHLAIGLCYQWVGLGRVFFNFLKGSVGLLEVRINI